MNPATTSDQTPLHSALSKVPAVTLWFWFIKICATTVGETGADAFSMPPLELGYAVASLIFLVYFAVTLALQVGAKRFHPFYYWAVVVGTTLVGTTMSDFLDRTLKFGYVKSSVVLFLGVLAVLFIWRAVAGKIEFQNIVSKRDEVFYWLTILVSNTLGTALGDFAADDTGLNLGFERGAIVFAALLALVAAAYFFTRISHAILFWAAYVLTRPLGATLGDTLDKPLADGGLNLSRVTASLVILAVMIVAIIWSESRKSKVPDALEHA